MNRFLRLISFATALVFSAQTVLWSAPSLSLYEGNTGGEVQRPSVEIQIPSEFGEIEGHYFAPGSDDFIVHIQDAHGNYDAQKSIENIIRYLTDHYGFQTLFLEGAGDRLDPSLFHFFSDRSVNLDIADVLMRNGEFSGGEMLLLDRSLDGKAGRIEGYGIESRKIYQEDLELFRGVIRSGNRAEEFVRKTEAAVKILESRFLSNELRDFLKEWRQYQAKGAYLQSYLDALHKQCLKSLSLDLKDAQNQDRYGSVLRILKLKDIERTLDYRKIRDEKEKVLEFLKGKVDEETLSALEKIEMSATSSGEKKFPRFLMEKIYDQAAEKGFDFKQFPNFSLFAEYLVFQSEISSKKLFEEVDLLTEKVFDSLVKTEQEKNLLSLIRDISLIEKFFRLEVSRKEFQTLSGRVETLTPSVLVKRVADVSAVEFDLPATAESQKLFDEAMRFYRLAEERENHFLDKMLSVMKKGRRSRAMVITGGFHAEGLQDKLREKGLSYLSVSPRIAKIGDSQELYLKSMLRETVITGTSQIHNPLYLDPDPASEDRAYQNETIAGAARVVLAARKIASGLIDSLAKKIRAGVTGLSLPFPAGAVQPAATGASLGAFEETLARLNEQGFFLSLDRMPVGDGNQDWFQDLVSKGVFHDMTTNPHGLAAVYESEHDRFLPEIARLEEEGITGATPVADELFLDGVIIPAMRALNETVFQKPAGVIYQSPLDGRPVTLQKPVSHFQGYVSYEMRPVFTPTADAPADSAEFSKEVHEALIEIMRLSQLIERKSGGLKNYLIKVPATPVGIEAGKRAIALGYNVNFTIVFTARQYEETAKAVIQGKFEFSQNRGRKYLKDLRTFSDQSLLGNAAQVLDAHFERLRTLTTEHLIFPDLSQEVGAEAVISKFIRRVDDVLDEALIKINRPDLTAKERLARGLDTAATAYFRTMIYPMFERFFAGPGAAEFLDGKTWQVFARETNARLPLLYLASTSPRVDGQIIDVPHYLPLLKGPGIVNTSRPEAINHLVGAQEIPGGSELTIWNGKQEAAEFLANLQQLGLNIEELLDRAYRGTLADFARADQETYKRIVADVALAQGYDPEEYVRKALSPNMDEATEAIDALIQKALDLRNVESQQELYDKTILALFRVYFLTKYLDNEIKIFRALCEELKEASPEEIAKIRGLKNRKKNLDRVKKGEVMVYAVLNLNADPIREEVQRLRYEGMRDRMREGARGADTVGGLLAEQGRLFLNPHDRAVIDGNPVESYSWGSGVGIFRGIERVIEILPQVAGDLHASVPPIDPKRELERHNQLLRDAIVEQKEAEEKRAQGEETLAAEHEARRDQALADARKIRENIEKYVQALQNAAVEQRKVVMLKVSLKGGGGTRSAGQTLRETKTKADIEVNSVSLGDAPIENLDLIGDLDASRDGRTLALPYGIHLEVDPADNIAIFEPTTGEDYLRGQGANLYARRARVLGASLKELDYYTGLGNMFLNPESHFVLNFAEKPDRFTLVREVLINGINHLLPSDARQQEEFYIPLRNAVSEQMNTMGYLERQSTIFNRMLELVVLPYFFADQQDVLDALGKDLQALAAKEPGNWADIAKAWPDAVRLAKELKRTGALDDVLAPFLAGDNPCSFLNTFFFKLDFRMAVALFLLFSEPLAYHPDYYDRNPSPYNVANFWKIPTNIHGVADGTAKIREIVDWSTLIPTPPTIQVASRWAELRAKLATMKKFPIEEMPYSPQEFNMIRLMVMEVLKQGLDPSLESRRNEFMRKALKFYDENARQLMQAGFDSKQAFGSAMLKYFQVLSMKNGLLVNLDEFNSRTGLNYQEGKFEALREVAIGILQEMGSRFVGTNFGSYWSDAGDPTAYSELHYKNNGQNLMPGEHRMAQKFLGSVMFRHDYVADDGAFVSPDSVVSSGVELPRDYHVSDSLIKTDPGVKVIVGNNFTVNFSRLEFKGPRGTVYRLAEGFIAQGTSRVFTPEDAPALAAAENILFYKDIEEPGEIGESRSLSRVPIEPNTMISTLIVKKSDGSTERRTFSHSLAQGKIKERNAQGQEVEVPALEATTYVRGLEDVVPDFTIKGKKGLSHFDLATDPLVDYSVQYRDERAMRARLVEELKREREAGAAAVTAQSLGAIGDLTAAEVQDILGNMVALGEALPRIEAITDVSAGGREAAARKKDRDWQEVKRRVGLGEDGNPLPGSVISRVAEGRMRLCENLVKGDVRANLQKLVELSRPVKESAGLFGALNLDYELSLLGVDPRDGQTITVPDYLSRGEAGLRELVNIETFDAAIHDTDEWNEVVAQFGSDPARKRQLIGSRYNLRREEAEMPAVSNAGTEVARLHATNAYSGLVYTNLEDFRRDMVRLGAREDLRDIFYPGARVLLVAEGSGEFLEELTKAYPDVHFTGIDWSIPAVAYGRERAEKNGNPIDLVMGNSTQLPFPDNSFDLIVFPAYPGPYRDSEINRVVTDSGEAIIFQAGPYAVTVRRPDVDPGVLWGALLSDRLAYREKDIPKMQEGKQYGRGSIRIPTRALKRGTFFRVFGVSGTGKSTISGTITKYFPNTVNISSGNLYRTLTMLAIDNDLLTSMDPKTSRLKDGAKEKLLNEILPRVSFKNNAKGRMSIFYEQPDGTIVNLDQALQDREDEILQFAKMMAVAISPEYEKWLTDMITGLLEGGTNVLLDGRVNSLADDQYREIEGVAGAVAPVVFVETPVEVAADRLARYDLIPREGSIEAAYQRWVLDNHNVYVPADIEKRLPRKPFAQLGSTPEEREAKATEMIYEYEALPRLKHRWAQETIKVDQVTEMERGLVDRGVAIGYNTATEGMAGLPALCHGIAAGRDRNVAMSLGDQVPPGTFFRVFGVSGTGKSTISGSITQHFRNTQNISSGNLYRTITLLAIDNDLLTSLDPKTARLKDGAKEKLLNEILPRIRFENNAKGRMSIAYEQPEGPVVNLDQALQDREDEILQFAKMMAVSISPEYEAWLTATIIGMLAQGRNVLLDGRVNSLSEDQYRAIETGTNAVAPVVFVETPVEVAADRLTRYDLIPRAGNIEDAYRQWVIENKNVWSPAMVAGLPKVDFSELGGTPEEREAKATQMIYEYEALPRLQHRWGQETIKVDQVTEMEQALVAQGTAIRYDTKKDGMVGLPGLMTSLSERTTAKSLGDIIQGEFVRESIETLISEARSANMERAQKAVEELARNARAIKSDPSKAALYSDAVRGLIRIYLMAKWSGVEQWCADALTSLKEATPAEISQLAAKKVRAKNFARVQSGDVVIHEVINLNADPIREEIQRQRFEAIRGMPTLNGIVSEQGRFFLNPHQRAEVDGKPVESFHWGSAVGIFRGIAEVVREMKQVAESMNAKIDVDPEKDALGYAEAFDQWCQENGKTVVFNVVLKGGGGTRSALQTLSETMTKAFIKVNDTEFGEQASEQILELMGDPDMKDAQGNPMCLPAGAHIVISPADNIMSFLPSVGADYHRGQGANLYARPARVLGANATDLKYYSGLGNMFLNPRLHFVLRFAEKPAAFVLVREVLLNAVHHIYDTPEKRRDHFYGPLKQMIQKHLVHVSDPASRVVIGDWLLELVIMPFIFADNPQVLENIGANLATLAKERPHPWGSMNQAWRDAVALAQHTKNDREIQAMLKPLFEGDYPYSFLNTFYFKLNLALGVSLFEMFSKPLPRQPAYLHKNAAWPEFGEGTANGWFVPTDIEGVARGDAWPLEVVDWSTMVLTSTTLTSDAWADMFAAWKKKIKDSLKEKYQKKGYDEAAAERKAEEQIPLDLDAWMNARLMVFEMLKQGMTPPLRDRRDEFIAAVDEYYAANSQMLSEKTEFFDSYPMWRIALEDYFPILAEEGGILVGCDEVNRQTRFGLSPHEFKIMQEAALGILRDMGSRFVGTNFGTRWSDAGDPLAYRDLHYWANGVTTQEGDHPIIQEMIWSLHFGHDYMITSGKFISPESQVPDSVTFEGTHKVSHSLIEVAEGVKVIAADNVTINYSRLRFEGRPGTVFRLPKGFVAEGSDRVFTEADLDALSEAQGIVLYHDIEGGFAGDTSVNAPDIPLIQDHIVATLMHRTRDGRVEKRSVSHFLEQRKRMIDGKEVNDLERPGYVMGLEPAATIKGMLAMNLDASNHPMFDFRKQYEDYENFQKALAARLAEMAPPSAESLGAMKDVLTGLSDWWSGRTGMIKGLELTRDERRQILDKLRELMETVRLEFQREALRESLEQVINSTKTPENVLKVLEFGRSLAEKKIGPAPALDAIPAIITAIQGTSISLDDVLKFGVGLAERGANPAGAFNAIPGLVEATKSIDGAFAQVLAFGIKLAEKKMNPAFWLSAIVGDSSLIRDMATLEKLADRWPEEARDLVSSELLLKAIAFGRSGGDFRVEYIVTPIPGKEPVYEMQTVYERQKIAVGYTGSGGERGFAEPLYEEQDVKVERSVLVEPGYPATQDRKILVVEISKTTGAALGEAASAEALQDYFVEHGGERGSLGASLGVTRDLTEMVYYLPEADETVLIAYRARLGGESQKPAISEDLMRAANAFNGDKGASELMAHLGISQTPEHQVPVVVFVDDVLKPGKDQTTDSIGQTIADGVMNPGDLFVAVWKGQANQGKKPPIIAKLYEAAKHFKVRDVREEILSGAKISAFAKGMDVPAISISSLDDTGDLELVLPEGAKVKLNIPLLLANGMDPTKVLSLVRQLADNPATRQHNFELAQFEFKNGVWEVGSSFVSLVQGLYSQMQVQERIAAAA